MPIIILLASFIILVLFLLTLQNTLKVIAPQNRQMRPGQVWLLLIPFFNFIWSFVTVKDISASIGQEYISRKAPITNKPTYAIGIIMCTLNCCYFAASSFIFIITFFLNIGGPIISLISVLISLSAFALITVWIIYWVKVNEYKNKILLLLPSTEEESMVFNKL